MTQGLFRLAIMGLAACLTSCASVTPLYGGPRRASDEVAVLKMVVNGAITKINGRELDGRAYELLPSKYAVDFRYILQGEEVHPAMKGERNRQRVTYQCSVEVEMSAGREYQISRKRPKFRLKQSNRRQQAGGPYFRSFDVDVFVIEVAPDGKVQGVQDVPPCG